MRYRTVHRIPSESISVVGRVATEATRPDRRLTGRTPPRWLALSEPAAVRQIRRRFLRCHRRTPPSPHRKEHRFVGLVGVFVMWRRWIALHFWLSFFSITRTFMVFIFFFGKYIRSLLSPLNRWWRDRFWSNRSSTGHDQALSVRWGPIQETLGVTNKESMKIKAVIIGFNNRLILTVVSPMNYVSRQCIGGEFFFTHFELVALLVKNGGGG